MNSRELHIFGMPGEEVAVPRPFSSGTLFPEGKAKRSNSLLTQVLKCDTPTVAMDIAPEILLKAYVQHQSEDAFRELVANTLDEVYSISLRIVEGPPHLASEVAVRVYSELERKAPRIHKDVVLASWLRERTCKMAVIILHEEDRSVDRAVLKREKEARSVPTSIEPAPAGLALRICRGIFLSGARRKGFRLTLPTFRWPAWLRPRHLGAAAVCVFVIFVWRSNPFHHRNRIIMSHGPLLTPSAVSQLASHVDGGPSTPGLVANTNNGTNPKQK